MEHIIDPKFFCRKKLTFAVPCYNHGNYISECLDSILAQELNVPFDILVCDDASTDNTPNVLREYLRKYPDKIKVIFLEKNGGKLRVLNTLFYHIKSGYFCIIDSDDYFCDTSYAKSALEFLDAHRSYVAWGGNAVLLFDKNIKGRYLQKLVLGLSFSLNELMLLHICALPQTSCVMFRNVVFYDGPTGDFLLAEKNYDFLLFRSETVYSRKHLLKGRIFIADRDVTIHRIHRNGIWSGISSLSRYIRLTYNYLRLRDIFYDYKSFYESVFFFNYSRVLKLIYKNRGDPNFLTQEDCDLLKEIFRLLPTANLDWSKLKWHSNILVKCFYKARTYFILLCRQMHRILFRKEIV